MAKALDQHLESGNCPIRPSGEALPPCTQPGGEKPQGIKSLLSRSTAEEHSGDVPAIAGTSGKTSTERKKLESWADIMDAEDDSQLANFIELAKHTTVLDETVILAGEGDVNFPVGFDKVVPRLWEILQTVARTLGVHIQCVIPCQEMILSHPEVFKGGTPEDRKRALQIVKDANLPMYTKLVNLIMYINFFTRPFEAKKTVWKPTTAERYLTNKLGHAIGKSKLDDAYDPTQWALGSEVTLKHKEYLLDCWKAELRGASSAITARLIFNALDKLADLWAEKAASGNAPPEWEKDVLSRCLASCESISVRLARTAKVRKKKSVPNANGRGATVVESDTISCLRPWIDQQGVLTPAEQQGIKLVNSVMSTKVIPAVQKRLDANNELSCSERGAVVKKVVEDLYMVADACNKELSNRKALVRSSILSTEGRKQGKITQAEWLSEQSKLVERLALNTETKSSLSRILESTIHYDNYDIAEETATDLEEHFVAHVDVLVKRGYQSGALSLAWNNALCQLETNDGSQDGDAN
mmetsp:Transcript_37706/g.52369  ORF Transcript_37706/g.52369 Transcript_37706/m.52369 type:complete len:527 (+) Transcript_37706:168-1748(+)|eukprot:CAMPEP_0196580942 /NCGR_PEP_ID=MMETSP1081-20130531/31590_1 /TAXON_ID=36882 /ORGANISM="Pyramimonas amylifera, Strain CCMP720" /LENGTH=526 /DNA_ID=CAMNT_0041900983 /DNA_START=172 /DNA_END=1752 /DNA_ORIENTATION=-